jgi:molybdopterin molybdotransferase
MIAYNDALQIIREAVLSKKLGIEKVPLAEAVDRVCADDLVANLDIQPFDNSAMDGFTVRLDDLVEAGNSRPVQLRKSGVIGAGQDTKGFLLEKGTCFHVMTGAPIPAGTEAIVPIENVIVENDMVTFRQRPIAGQHIRYAGEDFKKGAPLLSQGERITATHILPLATVGISSVTVFKRPRILFIPTGTEIIDDLGVPLANGQIYNSNKFYAVSFLMQYGAEVAVHDTVRDDLEHFAKALSTAGEDGYDIVVSSGAVSAGSFDFVKEGLEKAGAKILYHKIKLKPGKPNLVAVLPSGAIYFGLPGNPVATAVGLRFFVGEALRVLRGQRPDLPLYARAMNSFSKKLGLHMILKGRLEYWEDGSVTVDILEGQESFRVSPFLSMNCWIHVSEDQAMIKSGDVVEAYPLWP